MKSVDKKIPKVGIGVIIIRDNKILLLKRKNAHGQGTWSMPGGHLEFGESLENCAVRETEEETSIKITDVKFKAITNDIFKKENKHYITIWMEGKYLSGEPKINANYEMSEVGWFDLKKLPQPLFLPFKNLLDGKYY